MTIDVIYTITLTSDQEDLLRQVSKAMNLPLPKVLANLKHQFIREGADAMSKDLGKFQHVEVY